MKCDGGRWQKGVLGAVFTLSLVSCCPNYTRSLPGIIIYDMTALFSDTVPEAETVLIRLLHQAGARLPQTCTAGAAKSPTGWDILGVLKVQAGRVDLG
jgi:hypothetical protein